MKKIYLFNVVGTSVYKIGVTSGKPEKRLLTLQVGCPFPLDISKIYESKYGNKLEGILHRTFELNKVTPEEEVLPGVRLHGEWFHLNKEIVTEFSNKCKQIEERLDAIKKDTTLNNF